MKRKDTEYYKQLRASFNKPVASVNESLVEIAKQALHILDNHACHQDQYKQLGEFIIETLNKVGKV